jgi:hypothetical protein
MSFCAMDALALERRPLRRTTVQTRTPHHRGIDGGRRIRGGLAAEPITGAVVSRTGKLTSAGKAPHAPRRGAGKGISATLAAAQGAYGSVETQTSNPRGPARAIPASLVENGRTAADATNIVTNYFDINGEVRSSDEKFTWAIVERPACDC